MSAPELTGRRRFRVSPKGLVVLQVQTVKRYQRTYGDNDTYDWRDATIEDVTEYRMVHPEPVQTRQEDAAPTRYFNPDIL